MAPTRLLVAETCDRESRAGGRLVAAAADEVLVEHQFVELVGGRGGVVGRQAARRRFVGSLLHLVVRHCGPPAQSCLTGVYECLAAIARRTLTAGEPVKR